MTPWVNSQFIPGVPIRPHIVCPVCRIPYLRGEVPRPQETPAFYGERVCRPCAEHHGIPVQVFDPAPEYN